jgi:hypothetical protein
MYILAMLAISQKYLDIDLKLIHIQFYSFDFPFQKKAPSVSPMLAAERGRSEYMMYGKKYI